VSLQIRHRASLSLPLFCLLLLGACGGTAENGDAKVDAIAPDGGPTPGIAQIPWLMAGRPPVAAPVMTPCPEGWREYVESDGFTGCAPYGEEGPQTCDAIDEAHFPGTPGCARIGTACPADGFPGDLPSSGPVVYVSASAGEGGDGSRDTPFRTIEEASPETLAAGTTLALGVGSYNAGFVVAPGVTIVGACVASTSVSFMTGFAYAAIAIEGPGVTLRNFRVVGGSTHGVAVGGASGSVTLESVVIHETIGMGLIAINGSHVTATDIAIHDIKLLADGRFGRAVSAESGSSIEITRGEFTGNRGATLSAIGASGGAGAFLRLEDVSVRGGGVDGEGLSIGLLSARDGRMEVRRAYVADCVGEGVSVSNGEPSLLLEDVVVRGMGHNAVSAYGGVFEAHRVTLIDNQVVGIAIDTPGSATLSDIAIIDTRYPSSPVSRQGLGGIYVYAGAVELARGYIDRVAGSGFTAQGPQTNARLEDVYIGHGVRIPILEEPTGLGVEVKAGATAIFDRVVVEGSIHKGVSVDMDATSATFTDVAVLDTQSDPNGRFGYGITSGFGARVDGERVLVSGAHGLGMGATARATLDLMDAVIERVAPGSCIECADGYNSPIGVGIYRDAAASMTRFQLLHGGLCGLQIASGASMDLSRGEVRGYEIGACVQVPGYDIARLSDGVVYDNVTNLDTTTLPVPPIPATMGRPGSM